MSGKKRVVQSPASQADRVVADKPQPPENFWESMDKLHETRGFAIRNDPGFTLEEYCIKYGCARTSGHNRLAHLASEGLLIRGWAIRNGKRVRVYQPAPQPQ